MSRKFKNNFSTSSKKKVYLEVFIQQGNSPRPVPAPRPRPDVPLQVKPGTDITLEKFTSPKFWLVIAVEDSSKFKFWGHKTNIQSVNRKDFKFAGIGVLPALVIEILSAHDIDDEDENGDKDHEDMHVGSEDDKP